jgi:hypothetical protein
MRRAYQATTTSLSSQRERGGLLPGGKGALKGGLEQGSLGANECQTSVTEAAEEAMEQQKSGAKVGDKRHLSTSKVM